jgi:hypothetical protein
MPMDQDIALAVANLAEGEEGALQDAAEFLSLAPVDLHMA